MFETGSLQFHIQNAYLDALEWNTTQTNKQIDKQVLQLDREIGE